MASAVQPGFPETVRPLLEQAGLARDFRWTRLPGGANNRVYRIQDDRQDWVLKCYFQDPADLRDRFHAERGFYEFLWSHGVRCIPQPLAFDTATRAGLFPFVSERKLDVTEVDSARLAEAIAFITAINRHRGDPAALSLPTASESCFSLDQHLACVDRRVDRLNALEPRDELDRQACAFAREDLEPTWLDLRRQIARRADSQGDSARPALTVPERCLSPSDFGFHNALVGSDGDLCFIDFEYAGWDDPAKLICDFFCQPQIPVRSEHWNLFIQELRASLELSEETQSRARVLWPAYQVKWCCIMLNEFLRGDRERRAFAGSAPAARERRAAQLEKARQALRRARELWSCQF